MEELIEKFQSYSREYAYRHFTLLDPEKKELIELKLKELDQIDIMIEYVEKCDMESIIGMFENEPVIIPYAVMINDDYCQDDPAFGYEMKYHKALKKACQLGYTSIVVYLYDRNVYFNGCDGCSLSENLLDYLKNKRENNRLLWDRKYKNIHLNSIPIFKKDFILCRKRDYHLYKAIYDNDISQVNKIIRYSEEVFNSNIFYKHIYFATMLLRKDILKIFAKDDTIRYLTIDIESALYLNTGTFENEKLLETKDYLKDIKVLHDGFKKSSNYYLRILDFLKKNDDVDKFVEIFQ